MRFWLASFSGEDERLAPEITCGLVGDDESECSLVVGASAQSNVYFVTVAIDAIRACDHSTASIGSGRSTKVLWARHDEAPYLSGSPCNDGGRPHIGAEATTHTGRSSPQASGRFLIASRAEALLARLATSDYQAQQLTTKASWLRRR